MSTRTAAVMFSGGTDSTCATALLVERFDCLHLLTFDRYGFHHVERSRASVDKLKARFPEIEFVHRIIRIDKLFTSLSFKDYFARLRRFGLMMLQNCTFCALANHFRALAYCREHGIEVVADGVTRELQFLPSHMEKPIERMRQMYASYGIEYLTPVYDFDIPPEMNFFDKLSLAEDGESGVPVEAGLRTTGRYLQELGIHQNENIKGSALDRKLQYRCFQYVLHNLVAFGALGAGSDYERYEQDIISLYDDAITRFGPDKLADLSEGEVT